MNELFSTVITVLGYLTLIGQILIVFLLVLIFIPKKKNSKIAEIYEFVKANSINFAFIVASVATFGSLFLSEIAGFIPCKLCWWQRIFMYPSAIILLVALIKSDRGVVKYILPLSVIGAGIAVYHYVMQLFPSALECSEEIAKCSTIQFAEFGYITIPVMALTAFILIILASIIEIKK